MEEEEIYVEDETMELSESERRILEEVVAEVLTPEEPAVIENPEENPTFEEEVIEEVPLNVVSSTSENTVRFSDAIWYEKIQESKVILAGIGGIGSYVAFLLSRMNIQYLTLYDNDEVEQVNMAGQLFAKTDLGKSKVRAISEMVNNYSDFFKIIALKERFESVSPTGDIMICGFDNMASRKTFYEAWKEHVSKYNEEKRAKCLFIDGRLAAEEFQVLCITGDNVYAQSKYEGEFLFSDADVPDASCSYKQTTFMANMIGSVIINLFTNFIANKCNPIIDRDLPFYTEYNAETMYFKTEH